MTDPLDLSAEQRYFSQKLLEGLGVPKEFITGDSLATSRFLSENNARYTRTMRYLQHGLYLKQKNAPQLPVAKPYRPVSKNARKDFAKRQRRFLHRISFGKAAGSYIFDRWNEAAFARRIFGPFPIEEPPKRHRVTARERRWRRYHKTEPFPWET